MSGKEAVFEYTGREEVALTVVRVRVRSVDSIPERAFENCGRLRTVELPEGLRIIGRGAFQRCRSLERIQLPSSVTEIGEEAFSECKHLKSVNLPQGLRKIGEYAFFNCRLESVKVASSVAAIGNAAFSFCVNLKSVQLVDGLQRIGNRAFLHCRSLERIEIPPSTTKIGARAFDGCSNLMSVLLPEGIRNIGPEAFAGFLENFRFHCLSNRIDSIGFDRRTAAEIETKIAQISASAKRGGVNWTAGRDSLGKLRDLITYWELKEATTILELALWKAKVDEEGVEGEQREGERKAKRQRKEQTQEGERGTGESMFVLSAETPTSWNSPCSPLRNSSEIGSDEGKEEDSEGTMQLSREECRVKCGAGTVVKEVLSYFTYSRGWW